MDLHKLKTFRTVATLLNFNQAAKALNCAQSTISAQIKSLEDELGALLFKRIKKRIILTDAGEKMLDYTYKLLSIEEEALAEITEKKEPKGTLRLMVPETIAASYFPSVISEFITTYPTINFDISNCASNSLENELQIGSVDIAFIISESINSSNLRSEIILKERLVVVSSPDHPLAEMKQIDISNLCSQTIFLPKAGCGYGLSFRQLLDANISKPLSILKLTSIETIKKCVIQGLGLTILPKNCVQKEIQKNQLVELNWISDIEASVLMVWHNDNRISKALHAFMEIMRRLK